MPLADSYEKLGMLENAKKCYLRAHYVRDENGRTLINLAAFVYNRVIEILSY